MLLEFIPIRYKALIPLLNSIGYVFKHKTKVPNKWIPFLLILISIIISSITRYISLRVWGEDFNSYTWIDILVIHGVLNGFRCSLLSSCGYEIVRSFAVERKRREVVMLKKSALFKMLLSFAISSVIYTVMALALGSSFLMSFQKITDGWIFGILFMAVFDAVSRFVSNRGSITKYYICMQIMILFNLITFSVASTTATPVVCYIGLACAVLFGAGAGIFYKLAVDNLPGRGNADGDAFVEISPEDAQGDWIKVKAKLMKMKDHDKKIKLLEKVLAFRLLNDNILNGLDLDSPLIYDDGITYSVAKATEKGLDPEKIKEAKEYIELIV